MYRLKRFFPGPHVAVVLFICCTVLAGSIAALAGTDENIALLARTGKAFAAVVKKAGPAVVHIRVEKSIQGWGAGGRNNQFGLFNDPFFERFFGPSFAMTGSRANLSRRPSVPASSSPVTATS